MLKIYNFYLKNFAITDNQYSTYLIQNSSLKVFLYLFYINFKIIYIIYNYLQYYNNRYVNYTNFNLILYSLIFFLYI